MKKIALITGGENKEREISLLSAKNMLENIDRQKYEVDYFDFPNDKENFLNNYKKYDLVIPLIHGIGGEDGEITAFCEFVGKPYLFSYSHILKLCLDKYLAGLFVGEAGFFTPKTFLIRNIDDIKNINISGKIFVKPCNGGSSVDNGVFENIDEGIILIKKILTYDEVVVQEFIEKEREFSVSIIGDFDKNPEVIAISEIITDKEIFDYEGKYNGIGACEIIHANLDENLKNNITQICLDIYKLLKLKTFSRIDIIYSNKKIYFLEANTIPGFTPMSFVPKAIISSGISIKDFLSKIFG